MSRPLARRVAALVLALAGLAVYAATGPVFHLNRVEVAGDSWAITQDDVRTGLARSGKMSLLFGDFSQLVDQVAAQNLVRTASYSFVLPDGLRLVVQAREPYARSVDGGLVDSTGEWYQSETDANLPIFSMPRALMPQAVEFHTDAKAKLSGHGINITQVHHAWDGWRVFLDNGWVVLLGEHKKRQRLERFVTALPELQSVLQGQESLRLDMRYPHGLAVAGWQGRELGETGQKRKKGENDG